MTENDNNKLVLYGLDPVEYEHPLDKKALEALQGTPGLEKFLRWMNEHFTELAFTIQYTGSNVLVTNKMFPKLNNMLIDVCNTIHLKPVPEMYIEQSPIINAFTVGSENPIIVLNTATVELLTDAELKYIIGHEAGHIKSGHCLYHMMSWFLFPIFAATTATVTAGYSDIVTRGIELALQYWSRMSEYTADRAGLLACQDITAVTTTCMKMGGVPKSYYDSLDPQAFMEQARRFKDFDESTWKLFMKTIAIADSTHPWTVYRAKELDKWIESGSYFKLLKKRGVKMNFVSCPNPQCSNKVPESVKFCNACGTRIIADKS